MKKLLYIAPVIIDLENSNGVSKKVLNHFKIFKIYYNVEMVSYGLDCLYYFHDDIIDKIALNNSNRRIKLFSFINTQLTSKNKYDFVYIRYLLSDFLFINVLRILHKKTRKIVIEIPTFPYDHDLLKSGKGIIKYLSDLISIPFLKLYVGRIITYSKHDTLFGIKTINTINGIIFDDVLPRKKELRLDNEINLISVSLTWPEHGYDRLIEGLKNYYNKEVEISILYHLVGNGNEINKYEKLIKLYGLEKYVKLYGFINGQKLDEIYNKSDIAINSLGIHRIGLKTESTIKSKEYAAKGLPIVSSYEIDTFTTNDNKKYVLRVDPNDTPINIEKIILFYRKIYSDRSLNINNEIRNESRKKGDMIITLQGVIEYFNK